LLNVITLKKFQEKDVFSSHFGEPIKRAKTVNARPDVVMLGRRREEELQGILKKYMLKRDKEDVLGAELKGKKEIVVFCELSDLQRRLYMHALSLPEFDNAKHADKPCPCGSGDKRKDCCEEYSKPFRKGTDVIDPRAVLWSQSHPDGERCVRCPGCCFFTCMKKLTRIASHPALIQGDRTKVGSRKEEGIVEFASKALSPELLIELGGVYQATDFLSRCNPESSGKMKTLKHLLSRFIGLGEKVLVFSASTRMLDLIESMVKSMGLSGGHGYGR
jgi:SNF2 family DNA or RNA helicase